MTAARAFALVGAGYAAMLLLASLLALAPARLPVPELSLLVVLYLGLSGRGSPPAQAAVALGLGYLADLSAGSPKGLHALTLCVAVLFARGASHRLLVASTAHLVAVALVATVAHSVLLVAASAPMYGEGALGTLRMAPGVALATALLAPLMFAVLRRIDRRLLPEPGRLKMVL